MQIEEKGKLRSVTVSSPPAEAGFQRETFLATEYELTVRASTVEIRHPNYPDTMVEVFGGGIRNLSWDIRGGPG